MLIGLMKVVSVCLFNVLANLLLGFSISGHPDSSGSSLCTLNAFRMVVSDRGRYGGHALGLLQDIEEPAHGTHAAGVIIAPHDLKEYVPLQLGADTDGMITQYDKDKVEELGLLKMDFLV